MDTTTIILLVAAVAIVFMIYLRFYKKEKDPIIPEMDPRKDEYYDSPVTETAFEDEQENKENGIPEEETTMTQTEEEVEQENKESVIPEEEIEEENKEYDIPEEEITRIIPDEEINQYTDEYEKEMIRIYNYLISNGIKNLTGTNFFNIQENILLDSNSDHADLYSDIHQIFQITENRYVAITDLPDAEKQMKDQNHKTLKGILGIIECRNNLGHGRLELNKGKKDEDLNTDELSPVTEIIIGKNLLQIKSNNEISTIEPLSNEIEKLNKDYVAYLSGNLVYIRINRPACLDDLKTMVEILINFKY